MAEVLAAEERTCAIVANPVLYGMPGILRALQKVSPHIYRVDKARTFPLAPLLQYVAARMVSISLPGRFNDSKRNVADYALAYLRSQKKGRFFFGSS